MFKDPLEIRLLAQQNHSEDVAFLKWLEAAPIEDEQLDQLVGRLAREAMDSIDCIQCHNCCVEHQPQATVQEVEAMAASLGITVEMFLSKYTIDAPLADALIRRHGAGYPPKDSCCFLTEGRCTLYQVRPSHCRAYPDLEAPGFRQRLWDVLESCRVCPAAFSVYQELKQRMRTQVGSEK